MTLPRVDPVPGDSPSPLDAALFSAGRLVLRFSDLLAIASGLGWLDDDIIWTVRCDRQRELNPPDDDAIQESSESFRYEHELLTAEETERWLEQRGLSVDDFQLHCERLAVAAEAEEADDPVEDPAAAAAELGLDDEAWRVQLWLSDRLETLARRCVWLLLAAREAGQSWPDAVPDVAIWRNWEILLEQQREALLARPEAARLLESRRWPLTRVCVEVTEFPEAGMAREAELCLSEQSATMDEIVAGTGAERAQWDCLVHDLDEELQGEIVAIPVGGVRRLEKPDQLPRLIRVLGRSEPTLEDPDVRALVARRLQDERYDTIERETISWAHPLLRLA